MRAMLRVFCVFLTCACTLAMAAETSPAKKNVSFGSLAPIASKPAPASSHAPFEDGDCKICHQNSDPKQPGPVRVVGAKLCYECHEEYVKVMKLPHTHEPASAACTTCHNPHNAPNRKLLVRDTGTLCTACHDKVGVGVKVEHKALTTGPQCSSCHNPHASSVAKLLVQRPFDLCLSCHNTDTMVDANGKKLQNIKAWLDTNTEWHGPVGDKDCNGCHKPHGSDHFRLLEEDYPQEFYAPYDARTYALCFSCHNDKAFATAETVKLTAFRDGSRNLHYLHLQQGGKGRTCRACHEVHAGKQKSFVRDGVPYGTGGWILKLNYKQTSNGGSCAKTCHAEKAYVNNLAR